MALGEPESDFGLQGSIDTMGAETDLDLFNIQCIVFLSAMQ